MAKAPAEIRLLARAHTETAINTLAGIMSSKAAPAAARVAAAVAMLDRGWGRPETKGEMAITRPYVAMMPPKELDGDTWVHKYAPKETKQ